MGIFSSKKEEKIESPELTEEKILTLEKNIKVFIEEQKENIEAIFNDNDLIEQNVDYMIEGNNEIIKEKNKNPLTCLKDYAIQWSIKGNNKMNTTKCHLTFFNLGGLLGANGLLYSICEFYYFFSKIPSENRNEKYIIKDIEKCLKLIDNGNTQELNLIWRANITKEILNDLRMAKDFLLNLFHEKITNDIFETINNNFVSRIMRKCKSFAKGVSRFFVYIFYFLTLQLSNKKAEENEYLKEKNAINKFYLQKLLLNHIDFDFFSKYNIFILGSDDNTIPFKNLGVAFIGYYFEGLGEMYRARRLIQNEKDGFMTGNNINNNNKKLYNFYYQKVKDIKWFFERNKDNIHFIKKGMNNNNQYYINKLVEELDMVNESNLGQGSIDVLEAVADVSTQSTTQYTHNEYIDEERIRENDMSINNARVEGGLYNRIEEEMDDNRAAEARRILSNLNNNNNNEEWFADEVRDNVIAPNYEEENQECLLGHN